MQGANKIRNSKNPGQTSKNCSNVELLSGLRDELEDSLPHLRHDYITLRRQCCSLYKELRNHLKASFDVSFFTRDGLTDVDLGGRLVEAASGGYAHPDLKAKQKPLPGLRKLQRGLVTVFEMFIPVTTDEGLVAPLSTESVIKRVAFGADEVAKPNRRKG